MPIVVTEPAAGTPFGPAHLVTLSSTTVGPFVPPVIWEIDILDTDQIVTAAAQSVATSDPHVPSQFVYNPSFRPQAGMQNAFQQGQPAVLRAQLVADSTIAETVSIPIQFDTQAWIYNQVGAGGTTDLSPVLTDTEQLLADTQVLLSNWAQYTAITLPSLQQVLDNITASVTTTIQGAAQLPFSVGEVLSSVLPQNFFEIQLSGGVTCERVDADISFQSYYGLKVRIAQVPDGIAFRTPDGSYSFPDLAVLTVWRGGDIVTRHGIHTLSHTVSPIPGQPFPWATLINIPLQAGDTRVTVDWLPGVCGELVAEYLP